MTWTPQKLTRKQMAERRKEGVRLLEQGKKRARRYAKKIPGERVQIDTCKIAPGLYQYTAVDDCTRYQVLELYPRRTAQNTLNFLEKVVEEMPFPV